jgi:hypothetical protein
MLLAMCRGRRPKPATLFISSHCLADGQAPFLTLPRLSLLKESAERIFIESLRSQRKGLLRSRATPLVYDSGPLRQIESGATTFLRKVIPLGARAKDLEGGFEPLSVGKPGTFPLSGSRAALERAHGSCPIGRP